tara:strand:- start:50 stop:631 length:582 start_codon:yes stop_codon:yes gene_type:complete
MPNWCYNTLTVNGSTEEIHKVFDPIVADSENFFNHIEPMPATEKDNWYDWRITNWGTKWDATPEHIDIVDDEESGVSTVNTQFDTAWGPPIAIMEKLESMGFAVRLYYYEPGMGFAGSWEDGVDDDYTWGDMSSEDLATMLPQELDEMFNISEQVREWEEENRDAFVEWYEDGVEEKKLEPHDPETIFNNNLE